MPKIQAVTSFPTQLTSACKLLCGDGSGLAILASSTGTPPTTADTFQLGCTMYVTDASTGATAHFLNTGTVAVPVWSPVSAATSPSFTFVSDNSNGANNAICVSLFTVGTTKAVITSGSRVAIKLTHTLQKGANTVNINGTSKSLKNSTNLLDLTTPYVVGGVIEVMYLNGVSGGIYVDLKQ